VSGAISAATPLWTRAWIRAHPGKLAGVSVALLFRTLFGVFWLVAGIGKFRDGWLTTDILERIFEDRLTQMHPDSFAVFYLQNFALPLDKLVAFAVAFGELYVGIGLLLGLTTRWAAAMSFFILLNFSLGGYYDASLIPFFLLSLVFVFTSSGQWLGLDRVLARRHPGSRWFR